MSKLRDIRAAVAHSDPGYNPDPLPHRGDHFEQWLKAKRDELPNYDKAWDTLDNLLDDYRLHADTRTPLDEHVCGFGSHELDCE